jgi:hypothetical protein
MKKGAFRNRQGEVLPQRATRARLRLAGLYLLLTESNCQLPVRPLTLRSPRVLAPLPRSNSSSFLKTNSARGRSRCCLGSNSHWDYAASHQGSDVEENIISIGLHPDNRDNTTAIKWTSTVLKMKTFNNQSRSGVFLGCWNGTAHHGDLVTDSKTCFL